MTGFEVHDGTQPIGASDIRLTELIEGLAHQGAIFSRHGDEALGHRFSMGSSIDWACSWPPWHLAVDAKAL